MAPKRCGAENRKRKASQICEAMTLSKTLKFMFDRQHERLRDEPPLADQGAERIESDIALDAKEAEGEAEEDERVQTPPDEHNEEGCELYNTLPEETEEPSSDSRLNCSFNECTEASECTTVPGSSTEENAEDLKSDIVDFGSVDFCELRRNRALKSSMVNASPYHPSAEDVSKLPATKFGTENFSRRLPSGIFIKSNGCKRQWLTYSKCKNALFCIPCCIFYDGPAGQNVFAVPPGFSNWRRAHEKVKKHETLQAHLESRRDFATWRVNKTVDSVAQKQEQAEHRRRIMVLERLVDIVVHLAVQNSAFRGTSDCIEDLRCGNFLGLVKLMARRDPLLKSHLAQHADQGRGSLSYLSAPSQNEIIRLTAQCVRDEIIGKVKLANFFAILADTTVDRGRVDQLSICLRFVLVTDTVEIHEHFLGFLEVRQGDAQGLTSLIVDFIEASGLSMQQCRAQGYDGAPVMSGSKNGVAAKIKSMQPLAEYVHCAAHSLQLVLRDAAQVNNMVVTMFGVLHSVYCLFASSAHKWAVLTDALSGKKTVKRVDTTRWEARYDAVDAIISSFVEITNALRVLGDKYPENQALVDGCLKHLKKKNFQILLHAWKAILKSARVTSKALQAESCTVPGAAGLLKGLLLEVS